MKILIQCSAACAASILLLACSPSNMNNVYSTPESEGGRAIADLDRAKQDFYVRRDKQEYLETAKAFVNSAQQGDIKMMMNVTSPLTFKASGRSTVEKVYATQVIPAFQGTTVSWNAPEEIITDDTGNRGFVISGKATGAKSFPVYVTVMKERGKFRVITLTRKR